MSYANGVSRGCTGTLVPSGRCLYQYIIYRGVLVPIIPAVENLSICCWKGHSQHELMECVILSNLSVAKKNICYYKKDGFSQFPAKESF